jgi:hypothetical protein
MESKISA